MNSITYTENLPTRVFEYLNYLKISKGASGVTIKTYTSDLSICFRFLKVHRGLNLDQEFSLINIKDVDDVFIKQITLSELYNFVTYLNHEGNTSSSIRKRIGTIKSFYKFLYRKLKIIDYNISDELEFPKIPKTLPTYLTLEEAKELLNSLDYLSPEYYRDYCIFTLFLNCALRISELTGIDLDDIEDNRLKIRGKGNKERIIYLNKSCLKAIDDYLKYYRNKRKDLLKSDDVKALFISSRKRRISPRTIQIKMKKILTNTNIVKPNCTPHKLRHTCATLLYRFTDIDIRELQVILGHENISTTQIYTHVCNEDLREGMEHNPLNK